MKKTLPVIIILFLLIPSCTVFKDVFIDNYNGAGYFNELTGNQNGNLLPVDSLNIKEGFDAIVFMHVKMTYSNNPSVKPDEISGFPEIHFALTDAFINSDPGLKDEIRRRGILARWFKYYVIGQWKENLPEKSAKSFDSYAIVEVKSKMDVINIENIYLRFSGDSWLKIAINKNFRVEPGKFNYLGTLSIDLNKTDKYSGNVVQPAYTQYSSGIEEGYVYDLDQKLEYIEADYIKDIQYVKENCPNIFNYFGNKIVYFQWK